MSEPVDTPTLLSTPRDHVLSSWATLPPRWAMRMLGCPPFFPIYGSDACFRLTSLSRVFPSIIVSATGSDGSPFLVVIADPPLAPALAGISTTCGEPSPCRVSTSAIEGPAPPGEATGRGEALSHHDAPISPAVPALPPFQQGRRSRETTLFTESFAAPVPASAAAAQFNTPVDGVVQGGVSGDLYGGASLAGHESRNVGVERSDEGRRRSGAQWHTSPRRGRMALMGAVGAPEHHPSRLAISVV